MTGKLAKILTFRNLYLFLLFAMAACLPLSKYLASAAQILLAAAWLAEGRFDEKWRRIRMEPQIAVFTLLFFVPLAGMLWTQHPSAGLKELRVMLPLLLLPVVLGTIKPLNANEMKIILGGFCAAVMLGAVLSISIMLGIGPRAYTGDRESILFISHIRFALMVDLAIFILLYYGLSRTFSKWVAIGLLVAAGCLGVYLFILKSLTGVVILLVAGLVLGFRKAIRLKDVVARWSAIVGLVTLPVLGAIYLTSQIAAFYTVKDGGVPLDRLTALGNPYNNDTLNPALENGYHYGYYLCEPELRDAWNRVSRVRYDGPDRKGQDIRFTLMRYLTSKGLRKDAYGVSQLDAEDIRLVEEGYANCIYRHPGRFSVRIYQTIWEFDQYGRSGNASGLSVVQRYEYLKTGWAIFLDHPLLGTGTGGLRDAFNRKYDELGSKLAPEWRLGAHNQFLTFLVTYGIIGFILLMAAMILPVAVTRSRNRWFTSWFLLVALLSMLNEDTLDTQAGVAFFGLFYCLFVLADGSAKGQKTEDIRH